MCLVLSTACDSPPQPPPTPPDTGAPKTKRGGTLPELEFGDGSVARVNGVEIPRKAFDTYYDRFRISMHKNPILYPVGGAEAVKARVIKRLITEELIRQEAKKLGLTAPEDKVKAIMDETEARLKRDAQYAEYHRQLGTTAEQWRAEATVDVLKEEVLRVAVKEAFDIKDEVLKAAYQARIGQYQHTDEMKLSRIRFDISASATGDQIKFLRDRAKAVVGSLRKGAKFEELAKELSQGSSAERGGDIGWQPRLAFSSTIGDVLWKLKPGQFSEVLEDERGIYVYKVTGFRKAGVFPLDEVKGELILELRRLRQAELITKLLVDMKNNAKIEVLVPELEAAMTFTSTVMPEIPEPDPADRPQLPKSSHLNQHQ